MPFRPTVPAIPAELLDRFGTPEDIFGPNLTFRIVATICGVILLMMGVIFLLMGLAGVPLSGAVSVMLTIPLVALGVVVLISSLLVPLHWVFVCPRGLVRRRGDAWEGVGWAEVERFEDATLGQKGVTVRQCRIVTTSGAEWGFLADQIAEYGRLTEVLRRKIDEKAQGSSRN